MEWCQEAGCPAVWEDDWELSNNGRVNTVGFFFLFLFNVCIGTCVYHR